MGLIANVVPNAPIASAWGNAIRDRTIQAFANVAERDSQWTAPPAGATCVTLDTMTYWRFNGTIWVSPSYYNARATRAAAYTIPTALGGVIIMDTKVSDPSNSFNVATGVYTCKVAGTYLVKTQISATLGGAYTLNAHVFRNGASDCQVNIYQANGAIITAAVTLVICAVGDTLDPRCHTNIAGVGLRTNPNEVHFAVAYLGP